MHARFVCSSPLIYLFICSFLYIIVDSWVPFARVMPIYFYNSFIDIHHTIHPFRASLVSQRVKCLPAMRETRVQSLGWEDPLEKEMATHSITIAWKIPWTEELGRL